LALARQQRYRRQDDQPGNASASNLGVNNVPSGADPAAAVAKIKAYYGMPEPAANPRQAATAALMPKPPTMAFDGTPTDATAAVGPPPQQQIRQAPPVRIAQATQPGQPPAIPGYVPPSGGPEPPVPTKTPYAALGAGWCSKSDIAQRTGNQYTIDHVRC
jgi:hypothetical protein